MKLYFNRNFSGYNWYEINDVLNRQDKLYYTVNENSDYSPDALFMKAERTDEYQTISSLTLYGSYDAVFLKDGNGYVLAIKGIKEERTDEFGRGLNMGVIFIGDDNEFTLLHKILLYFISDKSKFSEEITALFTNSVDSIEFDNKSYVALLDNIATYAIVAGAHKISAIDKSNKIYAIISEFSDDKISEELHIHGFSKVKYSIKSIAKTLLAKPSDKVEYPAEDKVNNENTEYSEVLKVVVNNNENNTIFKALSAKVDIGQYTLSIYTLMIACFAAGFILGSIICKN